MAGFLYYKPGKRQKNQVTIEEAQSWGLGYAFDKVINSNDCAHNTPDGEHGFVFAGGGFLGEYSLGMYLEQQTWRKLPGRGEDPIWVGYINESPPTPEDLARDKQLPGYSVNLGDGNDWTIPLTRQFIEGQAEPQCALPHYLELDEDGNEKRGGVLKLHQHLWDATEPLAEGLMGEDAGEGEELEIDYWGLAATLMQANYRVDRGELSALGLFTDQWRPMNIGLFAIDFHSYLARVAEQKKTEDSRTEVGPTTSDGEAA